MSRLTVEFKPGVFIGKLNARVRDKLWDRVVNKWSVNALMIYTTNNEQGYAVRSNGETSREVADFDGLLLTEHTVS